MSIPVVCDRCRAEGEAGEDPFAAFGAASDGADLLRDGPPDDQGGEQ